jgi:hypothetical protein
MKPQGQYNFKSKLVLELDVDELDLHELKAILPNAYKYGYEIGLQINRRYYKLKEQIK